MSGVTWGPGNPGMNTTALGVMPTPPLVNMPWMSQPGPQPLFGQNLSEEQLMAWGVTSSNGQDALRRGGYYDHLHAGMTQPAQLLPPGGNVQAIGGMWNQPGNPQQLPLPMDRPDGRSWQRVDTGTPQQFQDIAQGQSTLINQLAPPPAAGPAPGSSITQQPPQAIPGQTIADLFKQGPGFWGGPAMPPGGYTPAPPQMPQPEVRDGPVIQPYPPSFTQQLQPPQMPPPPTPQPLQPPAPQFPALNQNPAFNPQAAPAPGTQRMMNGRMHTYAGGGNWRPMVTATVTRPAPRPQNRPVRRVR